MAKFFEYTAIAAADVDADDLILWEVDGVTYKMTKTELLILVAGVIGAAGELFTNLSGTTWDGSLKSKVLSGNTALTLTTTRNNGMIRIKQDGTGSRTLSINGQSLTINTAAGSTTLVSFLYDDVLTDFLFFVNTNAVVVAGGGGGGDVTAPTVVSMSIEDAAPDELVVTLNETANGTITPANADAAPLVNGVNPGLTGTPTIVGSVIRYFLAAPVAAGDTVTFSYAGFGGANAIQDLAGNKLANFSGVTVDNNVVGGGGSLDADSEAALDFVETRDSITVSGPVRSALSDYFTAIKAGTNPYSTKRKTLNLPIGSGEINLFNVADTDAAHRWEKLAGSTVVVNSTGFVFDGTSDGYNSNFTPSVDADDFELWVEFALDATSGWMFGVNDGTGSNWWVIEATASIGDHRINGANINHSSVSCQSGRFALGRTNDGSLVNSSGRKNGTQFDTADSSIGSAVGVAAAFPDYIGCFNNQAGGTITQRVTGTLKSFIRWGNLTPTEKTQVDTAHANLLTALGL